MEKPGVPGPAAGATLGTMPPAEANGLLFVIVNVLGSVLCTHTAEPPPLHEGSGGVGAMAMVASWPTSDTW
jgi:hypothetical protein